MENLIDGLYVGFAVLWAFLNVLLRPDHVGEEVED